MKISALTTLAVEFNEPLHAYLEGDLERDRFFVNKNAIKSPLVRMRGLTAHV